MILKFIINWFLINISFRTITCMTYSCSSNAACGCSVKSAIVTKIIGGEDAEENTWGWAVSLRKRNSHICGGSLISSELVLTAAHCIASVNTLSSLSITAGSNYLSIINQQRSVLEIYIPYNYDSMTYSNDIAVIYVSPPFDMTDSSLRLICLPSLTYLSNETTVVAIGWGVLSETDRITSNTLQQVTLKIIPNAISSCSTSMYDENTQLCAGIEDGGKDTCQGDSGGPLMTFSNQRWYLIGITSYGHGCASPYYSGVYTRVSTYIEYIDCFLRNKTSCIRRKFILKNAVSSIAKFYYIYYFLSILIFIFIHFSF